MNERSGEKCTQESPTNDKDLSNDEWLRWGQDESIKIEWFDEKDNGESLIVHTIDTDFDQWSRWTNQEAVIEKKNTTSEYVVRRKGRLVEVDQQLRYIDLEWPKRSPTNG